MKMFMERRLKMQINILEILVKGAPESLLVVLCVYFFCKIKPKISQLAILWFLHVAVTFITRIVLPGYGMSLLITLIVLVVIFNLLLKVPLTKVINGAVLCILFVIIAEALNFLLIQVFFPGKTELILNDATARIIYMIPSTVFMAISVLGVYYFNFKRKKKEDV